MMPAGSASPQLLPLLQERRLVAEASLAWHQDAEAWAREAGALPATVAVPVRGESIFGSGFAMP